MTQTCIGVDVSKDWIDVYDGDTGRHDRIAMERRALAGFAREARGRLVVLEASGAYERPLTDALEAAGGAYARVNPRQAREFARASGQLAKTDRVDAAMLARMGAALQPSPTVPVGPERRRLAALLARREDLVAARRRERNRLAQSVEAWVRRDIASMIRILDRRLKAVETEIAAQIAADPGLRGAAARLRAVAGVGPQTAAVLLAHLPELGRLDRRRIASLAGLAPRANDSGRMRGRRSVWASVWGGRPQLRRALFIAALVGSRTDAALKAFRHRLEAAGKSKKTAILATARKLVTILNAMMRTHASCAPKPQ